MRGAHKHNPAVKRRENGEHVWKSIDCPKCGSVEGKRCNNGDPDTVRHINHQARWDALATRDMS